MVRSVEESEYDVSLTDRINTPPAAVDAERALLGALMLDAHAWDRISGKVSAVDFYRRDHQLIFEALGYLAVSSRPMDAVTVAEYLENLGKGSEAGGLAYIGGLVTNTPSAANATTYAEIVHDKGLLRSLIEVGNDIAASAFHPEGRRSDELVGLAEQKVFDIAEKGKSVEDFVSLQEVCGGLVDKLDELHRLGADITGLKTGYDAFDDKTQGLQKGDLVILAGRPSMGKTTLALNIAEYAAFNGEKPTGVAVFSMEMSTEQLALRFVSSLGKVPQGNLRNGKFSDDDWPKITSALEMMAQSSIYIDDTPALGPGDLRSRARRLQRQHKNIGLIVVDYLQLMQVPGTNENRTNEISEISRGLKALARELEVPVIALSQLNRSVEQRPDKRPVMSDLRESGAIEQDADLVLFIYRDEVYHKDSDRKGQADIIIAKHRNGEIGDFRLTFRGQFSRFENYVPEFDIPAGPEF